MTTQRDGIDVPGRIDDDGMPRAGKPEMQATPLPLQACGWAINCYGGNFDDDEWGRAPGWVRDPEQFVQDNLVGAFGAGELDTVSPLDDADVDSLWMFKPTGRREGFRSDGREHRLRVVPFNPEMQRAMRLFVETAHQFGKRAVLYTGCYIDGVDRGIRITDSVGALAELDGYGLDAVYFDNARDQAAACVKLSESSRVYGVEPTMEAGDKLIQVAHQCALHRYRPAPWHWKGATGGGRRIECLIDGTGFGGASGTDVMRNVTLPWQLDDLVARRWRLVGIGPVRGVTVVNALRRVRASEGGRA